MLLISDLCLVLFWMTLCIIVAVWAMVASAILVLLVLPGALAGLYAPSFSHSLLHSFLYSFVRFFIHSSVHSCIQSFVPTLAVMMLLYRVGLWAVSAVSSWFRSPLPPSFFSSFFFNVGTSSLFRLVTFSILCFAFFSFPTSSAICLSFCLLVGFLWLIDSLRLYFCIDSHYC